MKVVHKVEVFADVRLTQAEIGALDALAGYGTDEFLDVFYTKLGKAYLQPYESGLRTLFDKVRGCARGMDHKVRDAELVLRGTHVPTPKPKTNGEVWAAREIEPVLPLGKPQPPADALGSTTGGRGPLRDGLPTDPIPKME